MNTRDPIALFSKLSYEEKNGWNKIFKGFVPLFFFFLLVSGVRNGLDK